VFLLGIVEKKLYLYIKILGRGPKATPWTLP